MSVNAMTKLSRSLLRLGQQAPQLGAAETSSIIRSAVLPVRCLSSQPDLKHLQLTRPSPFVVDVKLNRPKQRNALNFQLWRLVGATMSQCFSEIGECFEYLSTDADCRVVVLSAAGPTFCAGIDLNELGKIGQVALDESKDVARKAVELGRILKQFQDWFTAIEKCPKPVIAACHGATVGGGASLITAADIRYATRDATFSIKEVDIGITADVGALQRLPSTANNQGAIRELCFTARTFDAQEAKEIGLVTRLFDSQAALEAECLSVAECIASKSPAAVQGTKLQLNYARDHSVDESLLFMRIWNMFGLQSEDIMKAAMAAMAKEGMPEFAKL